MPVTTGTDGNDVLTNSDNGQTINALGGNDDITDNASGAIIDGGTGEDILRLTPNLPTAFTLSFTPGAASNPAASDGTLVSNIECLILATGQGNDSVTFHALPTGDKWPMAQWAAGQGEDTLTVDFGGLDAEVSTEYPDTGDYYGYILVASNNSMVQRLSYGSVEHLNITGGSRTDMLVGGPGSDVLNGGAGDDSIHGSGGDDILNGGDGVDTLSYDQGYGSIVIVNLLTGTATAAGALAGTDTISNFENVFAYGGADVSLTGSDVSNTLVAGNGRNYLYGEGGDDWLSDRGVGSTIDGGAGNDWLTIDRKSFATSLTFTPGSSTSTIMSDGTSINNVENIWLTSGADNDSLTFNGILPSTWANGNRWDAGDGSDTLTLELSACTTSVKTYNSSGSGTLTANGASFIYNGVENFVVKCGSGNDDLQGYFGSATFYGGHGDDLFANYSAGTNNFVGGEGGDLFVLSGGTSVVDGGTGYDTISFSGATAGLTISLANPGVQSLAGGMGSVTLSGIDQLDGTQYGDSLTGSTDADHLVGEGGDDILFGGAGNDALDGNAGSDTAKFSGNRAAYVVTTGVVANSFYVTGLDGTDVISDVEMLQFDDQSIAPISAVVPVSLTGSSGADTLVGTAANDTINGGAGNDVISGGAGNDTLGGGADEDTITGGGGDNTLDGGSSVDTAVFLGNRASYTVTQTSTGNFTISGSGGTDTLTGIEYAKFGDQTIRLLPDTGVPVNWATDPSTYMGAIRDFDGNDLGGAASWKLIGRADVNGDGQVEHIFFNQQIGRWAEVAFEPDTLTYFSNYGWAGDTRVVGIYIDPLVANGTVVKNSDFDSQRRFQNDLFIDNIKSILGQGDYNHDGLQEIYFSLTDGTAYLHAYMHADGNIQYANYQNKQQVIDYLTANGIGSSTWSTWFPASQAPMEVVSNGPASTSLGSSAWGLMIGTGG